MHRMTAHAAAVKALAWCPFQSNLLASGGGTADRCIKFLEHPHRSAAQLHRHRVPGTMPRQHATLLPCTCSTATDGMACCMIIHRAVTGHMSGAAHCVSTPTMRVSPEWLMHLHPLLVTMFLSVLPCMSYKSSGRAVSNSGSEGRHA